MANAPASIPLPATCQGEFGGTGPGRSAHRTTIIRHSPSSTRVRSRGNYMSDQPAVALISIGGRIGGQLEHRREIASNVNELGMECGGGDPPTSAGYIGRMALPGRIMAHHGTTSCGPLRLRCTTSCGSLPARSRTRPLQGEFGGEGPGCLASHTRTTSRGMPSPNFRNRIRAHRKNFETGPRLSNSLPQESQIAPWLPARVTPPVPRLPPGAGRTLGGPALQPPDCVRSGPTALWRVQRDSYTSPAGPCQVGHIEELPDMPRARLWRLLQGFAASAAPSPT